MKKGLCEARLANSLVVSLGKALNGIASATITSLYQAMVLSTETL